MEWEKGWSSAYEGWGNRDVMSMVLGLTFGMFWRFVFDIGFFKVELCFVTRWFELAW